MNNLDPARYRKLSACIGLGTSLGLGTRAETARALQAFGGVLTAAMIRSGTAQHHLYSTQLSEKTMVFRCE